MAEATQSLPLGLALLILAVGAVGVVFLFAGQHLLSAALACLGLGGGALVGWALADVLLTGVPAWACVAVAGLVGMVLAGLATRLAAALGLAGLLALAGWLGVASAERHGWIGIAEAPSGAATEVDAPTRRDDGAVAEELSRAGARGMAVALASSARAQATRLAAPLGGAEAERHLGALRGLAADGVALLGQQWQNAARPVRTLMLACAAVCGFLGLCLGLLAGRWTAAFVTAVLGALLVVLAAAAIAQQIAGDPATLPGTRAGWTMTWAAIAMAGATYQWLRPVVRARRRKEMPGARE